MIPKSQKIRYRSGYSNRYEKQGYDSMVPENKGMITDTGTLIIAVNHI